MKILTHWHRLEQVCLNPTLRSDPKVLKQAQIMLAFCLLAGLLCLGTIVLGAVYNPEYTEYYCMVAIGHILACSSFILLKVCTTMRIPSTVMMITTLIQLMQAPVWTGFIESPVLYTYPLASMFMGVIGGRRNALITGFALSVVSLILWWLGEHYSNIGAGSQIPFVSTVVLIWCTLSGASLAMYNDYQEQILRHRIERELEVRTAAQKESEQANEAKDLFLSYLSHEIRNPLMVVVAGTEMITKNKQASTIQSVAKYIQSLQNASLSLSRLLDDVFDFTSLEQSRLELRSEVFNLSSLLCSVHDEFLDRATSKGLEFTLEVHGTYWIEADGIRLRQIIVNLVGNALKFTTEGHVTLGVKECSSEQIEIFIEDTGTGISPDHIQSIFRPFVRERSVHTPGIGLGLAICKGLLEQMNSQIHLESVVGKGSRFSFSFPLEQSVSTTPSFNDATKTLQGLKILLVDDNREMVSLMTAHCQSIGMNVVYSFDGFKGLELARTFQPEIVLVDYEMPNLSGTEFIELFRQIHTRSKVILFTGSTITDRPFNVDAILQKPIEMSLLEQVFLQVLDD